MRIKLRYPDVDTFVQKYAVNVSRGGIFIATRQPKPIGTFLRFEFLLADATSIIRGEGQVQWTKEVDPEHPARAHGMGIKFTRLDRKSQALIDRVLQWRTEHGTSPGTSLAELATTANGSHSGPLPASSSGPEPLEARHPRVLPAMASGAPPTTAEVPPLDEATRVMLFPPPDALPTRIVSAAEPAPAAPPSRGETRPILVSDEPPRAPHESTRPLAVPPPTASRTDELDLLATEWGLTEERLAKTLRRARPPLVEATAELERLLRPPRSPAPSRAEAVVRLDQLLTRRGGSTTP